MDYHDQLLAAASDAARDQMTTLRSDSTTSVGSRKTSTLLSYPLYHEKPPATPITSNTILLQPELHFLKQEHEKKLHDVSESNVDERQKYISSVHDAEQNVNTCTNMFVTYLIRSVFKRNYAHNDIPVLCLS